MSSGLTISRSEVSFGGVVIAEIVKRYKTPVFLFSEQRVIDNFKALSKAFKKSYPNSAIFYSIKTNFEPQILKTLKSCGSFGEAASALEVKIAQKAGFAGSDLILDGPAWSEEDIVYCVKIGIKTFNIDSVDLAGKVNQIAKKLGKRVRMSFRIYPEIRMPILARFAEVFISKFGVPFSQAQSAYRQVKAFSNLIPIGISAHIGSMITDPGYYERTIDKLVDLAAKLKSELDIEVSEINLGGGFGIQSLNYYSIQNFILEKAGISAYTKASSIEEFGRRIGQKFSEKLRQNNLTRIQLVVEPGRFLVSDAGILLTKVVAVKKNWIFIDGGINLVPESIFFVRRGFVVADKVGKKATKKYNIAGPTLNTVDVLAQDQKLPEIEVGDTIIVLDAGAYSLTRSNQFTILRPDVLYITKTGKIKFLRKKEDPKGFIEKLLI